MSYLAELYDNYGFVEEAVALWEEYTNIARAVYGDNHPDTIQQLQKSAEMMVWKEKFSEAAKLMEQVVHWRKTFMGLDHFDTLTSLKVAAEAYQGVPGKEEKSEQLYLECIEGFQRLREAGDESCEFELAAVKASLGFLYVHWSTQLSQSGAVDAMTRRNEYMKKALQLYEEAKEVMRTICGEESIHYLRVEGNLASYYISVNAFEREQQVMTPADLHMDDSEARRREFDANPVLGKAEAMLRTVVRGLEQAVGPDHDYTISYSLNLALLLFNEKHDYREAATWYQRAAKATEAKYSVAHAKTLTLLYPLSICQLHSGQLDAAIHTCITFCSHTAEVFGENSKESKAGIELLDQLRSVRMQQVSALSEE